MKYIKPSMKVREAQSIQMLAESLAIISGENVNGSEALTKEDSAWDIWDEDAE